MHHFGHLGGDPAAPGDEHVAQEHPAADDDAGTGFVCSKPILMIGAAGDEVAELGHLLAKHGFANAISQGKAAAPPVLNDALMQIVTDFQQANGLNPWEAENGEGQPTLRSAHLGIVDARTWEALLGYQPKVLPAGVTA